MLLVTPAIPTILRRKRLLWWWGLHLSPLWLLRLVHQRLLLGLLRLTPLRLLWLRLTPLLLTPLWLLRLLHPPVLLYRLLVGSSRSMLCTSFTIIANVPPDIQSHQRYHSHNNDHVQDMEDWAKCCQVIADYSAYIS